MINRINLILIYLSIHINSTSQSLEGTYIHSMSKVLGSFRISQTTELEIRIDENKRSVYHINTVVVDEYNGGNPRREYSNGTIKKINTLRYNFIGSSYGERGAYITFKKPPKDPVSQLMVSFAPNRGSIMLFSRQD
jgi:hypothetical protein